MKLSLSGGQDVQEASPKHAVPIKKSTNLTEWRLLSCGRPLLPPAWPPISQHWREKGHYTNFCPIRGSARVKHINENNQRPICERGGQQSKCIKMSRTSSHPANHSERRCHSSEHGGGGGCGSSPSTKEQAGKHPGHKNDKKKLQGVRWVLKFAEHQILFTFQEFHTHQEYLTEVSGQFSNIKLRNVFMSSSGFHLAEPTWRHHKGPLALFLYYFQSELNQISWCWVSPAALRPHEK